MINLMELNIPALRQAMEAEGYIAEHELVVTVYLALKLEKPILVTGAPGVGKTELAKVISAIFNAPLIRLQCYEGLDENKALYEWNYQKQLLSIQLLKDQQGLAEDDLFSPKYLLARPLLKALTSEERPVLLIDEIDKTDAEFEAFLFEILSDFQVSIPELGTIKARQVPMVVLTSNGERDLSDGLKRRCLFLNIGFPSIEKELQIVRTKVPEAGEKLAVQVAYAVAAIRQLALKKQPSIAETLDWARALTVLGADDLTPEVIANTGSIFLKDGEDQEVFDKEMGSERLSRLVKDQAYNYNKAQNNSAGTSWR